jgi:hypothetical protein
VDVLARAGNYAGPFGRIYGDNGRRSGAQDSQLPGGERAAGQLALPGGSGCA